MKRILILMTFVFLMSPDIVQADELEDLRAEIDELNEIIESLIERVEELEGEKSLEEDTVEVTDNDDPTVAGDKDGSFRNPYELGDIGSFTIDNKGSTGSIEINNILTGSEAENHINNGYGNRIELNNAPQGFIPLVIDLDFKIEDLIDDNDYSIREADFTSTLENGSEISERPVDIGVFDNNFNITDGVTQNFKVSLFVPEDEIFYLKFENFWGTEQAFFKIDE